MSDPPQLRLDPIRVSVQPGSQVSVTLSIRNPGTIVEGYAVDLVGDGPPEWADVIPAEVSVYPQQEETVTIVFTPADGTRAAAGPCPYGVRVRSTVDPTASEVVEGDLEVGRVFGLQAKIIPVNSAGRWRGRHLVQLSNWGNAPARVQLSASDQDDQLGFLITPDLLDLPLGSTRTARIRVRARRPFLRGTPVRWPFQIVGEPLDIAPRAGPAPIMSDPGRPVVDAALTQRPILSRAVVTAGVVAVVLALAGGAFAAARWPGSAAPALADATGRPTTPRLSTQAEPGQLAVKLIWTSVRNVTGYQTVEVEPTGNHDQVAPPTTQSNENLYATVPVAAAGRHCFQIRAVRAPTLLSTWSDRVCATVAELTASPPGGGPSSPPGSGGSGGSTPPTSPPPSSTPPTSTPPVTFSPGQWVAVTVIGLVPDSIENAETLREAVTPDIGAAQVVTTEQYPKLGPRTDNNSYLVAVGPYATTDEAQEECEKIKPIIEEAFPQFKKQNALPTCEPRQA